MPKSLSGEVSMMATVNQLWIYPIKSCGGISLTQVEVTLTGFKGDRQWMIVDREGNFLTQRTYPQLARVNVQLTATELILDFDHLPTFRLPTQQTGDLKAVTVWRSHVQAIDQGDAVALWFSEVLQIPCRLVRQSPDHIRAINPKFALWENQPVSFADGYPILLANTASLALLNQKLPQPIPMDRFRPNLVVATDDAFCEDDWQRLSIDDLELVQAKPCDRCIITTTDQQTGDRHPQKEPLRTLQTFRYAKDKGILFGINLMPTSIGAIAIGDRVTTA